MTAQVLPDLSRAEYSQIGYLLFVRDNDLVAQKFDPARIQLSGEVTKIAKGIPTNYGYGAFSSSEDGVLAYRAVGTVDTRLAIYDRAGKVLKTLSIPAGDNFSELNLSPDNERLAVSFAFGPGGNSGFDVWIFELSSGRFFPLTNSGASATGIWSPNENYIAFCKRTDGYADLFEAGLENGGAPKLLYHSMQEKLPLSWSHNGKYLVYSVLLADNKVDYMVLPLVGAGERVPYSLISTASSEPHASISPDDHWIAFDSSESGMTQIYVTSFPQTNGRRYQLSLDGGGEPSWDKSGHTIYYLGPRKKMMAVDLNVGQDIIAAKPHPLFQKENVGEVKNDQDGVIDYVMIPDGPKFVLRTREPQRAGDIDVVVNARQILRIN